MKERTSLLTTTETEFVRFFDYVQTVIGKPIGTRHEMRQQVFEFIEIYYNRVRRHSAKGWVAPVEFERLYHQN